MSLGNKIFYTKDSFRNLMFFYTFLDDKRVKLGHIHTPKGMPVSEDKLDVIFRRYREVMPRTINVHISDIIDERGRPKDLRLVKVGRGKKWLYTYANGTTRSINYNSQTRSGDARYFAELIKARYDIEEGSMTALIVEHACNHLV